jgi:hypothetical protein
MWIHARKEPKKQWLQLCYCITKGEIDMVIKDWEGDWKIPRHTYKDNERGEREGKNTSSGSPSAHEMKDGPEKNKEDEQRDR